MKARFCLLIIIILVSLISLSCSRSGNTPTYPSNMENSSYTESISSIPVGVTDWNADGSPSGGMGMLGLFNLSIDPSMITAELTPLREGALTDVLEIVDITNFLQMAPCTNCAKIKSVELDPDDNLVVDIGIKHPFPTGDPFKPISGRNRADLHVFNVEGIVISNQTITTYPALDESIADFKLLNADGYTRYLDASLDDIFPTEATIHPYVLHFDDYSRGNFDPLNPMGFQNVTIPPPSGNLVMAQGCDYDVKSYVFEMTSVEPMNFIYAVGCTFPVASVSKNDRFTPEYRIPQHNKKAASEVSIAIVSNDLKSGNISSTAEIEIRVVDISHGVPTGDALDQMHSDSSVNDIFIEIPGVMTDMLVLDGSSPISGIGHDPSVPLIYAGTITNTAGAIEGIYSGLIKVTDNYAPEQNGSPLLNGMDGITRVDPLINPLSGLFTIDEFATYQTFRIDIAIGSLPPVGGTISFHWDCPGDPCPGFPISFEISEAYDPDGNPVTITWDFDGNLDFADDLDGDNTNLIGEYVFAAPGSYNAWCRIDDSTEFTNVGPLAVTVSDCVPDNPQIANTVTYIEQCYRMDINEVDGYVYIANSNGFTGALEIIDINPIDSAYDVKRVPLPAWTATCAYYDGYVYASGQAQQGVVVIDVDPPEDAYIVGQWQEFGWFTGSMEDMYVQDHYLYVAAQWFGFMIFDLTDPSNPDHLSHVDTTMGRYTYGIIVSEDGQYGYCHEGYWDIYGYVPDYIHVIDISNPNSPSRIGSVLVATFPMDLALSGNYVYAVANPWASNIISVVDVSVPTNPTLVVDYAAPFGGWVCQADGDYLYISGDNLGIIDISNPSNPTVLTTYDIPNDARGMSVYCGIAYISAYYFSMPPETTLNIVQLY